MDAVKNLTIWGVATTLVAISVVGIALKLAGLIDLPWIACAIPALAGAVIAVGAVLIVALVAKQPESDYDSKR